MPFKAAHDNGVIDLNPCASAAVQGRSPECEEGRFQPSQISALSRGTDRGWKGMITRIL
jgi:hypothetical protein